MHPILLIATGLALAGLTACGQKGPLIRAPDSALPTTPAAVADPALLPPGASSPADETENRTDPSVVSPAR